MIREFTSLENIPFSVDDLHCQVFGANRIANRLYEITEHYGHAPRADLISRYIVERGINWPARTTAQASYAFSKLSRFALTEGAANLTAESFGRFQSWLRTPDAGEKGHVLDESIRRLISTMVLVFVEWAADNGHVDSHVARKARLRHKRAFRGFQRRARAKRKERALEPVVFVRLLRAIRMELEDAVRLLDATEEEQALADKAMPLIPAVLLLALTLAVRASEINYADRAAIFESPGAIRVHAPNKAPALIELPDGVKRALDVALRWMERYCPAPGMEDPLFVVPGATPDGQTTMLRFDSIRINCALDRFYAKYFRRRDANGRPVLYVGADANPEPFRLSFANMRAAALTEAARHEPNPEKLRLFARHKALQTTWDYYVLVTHMQWVSDVALRLAPSSEMLRMAMENRVVGSSEEIEAARKAGALVKGGHCNEALKGNKLCLRATDCRYCEHFRIHVDKRGYFLYELENLLRELDMLRGSDGGQRDIENVEQRAALNQAIIDRIDDYLTDEEAA